MTEISQAEYENQEAWLKEFGADQRAAPSLSPETIARVRSALDDAISTSGALLLMRQNEAVRMILSRTERMAKDASALLERDLSRGDLQGAIEQEMKELGGE